MTTEPGNDRGSQGRPEAPRPDGIEADSLPGIDATGVSAAAAAPDCPDGRITAPARQPIVVGRYAMYDEIATGGMASVHFGRLLGPVGFSRTVAIKRLHGNFAKDPGFAAMFLDEARLAARIHHPNVVPTLDVVATEGELFIVMEYVHGASLAQLVKLTDQRGTRIPLHILGHLLSGMLQGLHAAHEARSDGGELLGIVHRDVSPQNLLVGMDGMPRLVDFGVAKAIGRVTNTQDGTLRGKLGYMSPEQLSGEPLTRLSDIYGAGVVLWHALTAKRPVDGKTEAARILAALRWAPDRPSLHAPDLPKALDRVVAKATSRVPSDRYPTAAAMASDFEQSTRIATQREVAEWMAQTVGPQLAARSKRLTAIESASARVALPAEAADDGKRQPRDDAVARAGDGATANQSAGDEPLEPLRRRGVMVAAACLGGALVAGGLWLSSFGGASSAGSSAGAASAADGGVLADRAAAADAAPSSSSAVTSGSEPGIAAADASIPTAPTGADAAAPERRGQPTGKPRRKLRDRLYVLE